MIALAVLLGFCAALMQGGPLAALGDGGAAVALPGAFAAGWAAVRGPQEAIALVFAAAVALGVLSEAQVGLFALALMPAAAIGTLAGAGSPGRQTQAFRATGAGLLGAASYLALLAAAAGRLPDGGAAIAWGLAVSALVAAATCTALLPWRPPDRRLFA